MVGAKGDDILVGGIGSDIFLFRGFDIGLGLDTIGDQLELFGIEDEIGARDVLDGVDIIRFADVFDVDVDENDLSTYFQLDENSDGTLVSVDRDGAGAGSGSGFEQVVQIDGYFDATLEEFFAQVEIVNFGLG